MERAEMARTAASLVAPRSAGSRALSMRGTEQLNDAEFETLNTLMKQMQAYYPHQEFLQETVDGYQFDMERLAVRYGLHRVRAVLLELRLTVGQKFFPHPEQVLDRLEADMAKQRAEVKAAHPYVPDPACQHVGDGGWRRTKDADGDDVAVRCDCWLRWKRDKERAAHPADGKAAAAGA